MATTFQNIYQDVLKRFGEDTSDTDLLSWVKSWINQRYKYVCGKKDWPFLTGPGVITTIAKYDTGTVDITEAGTTVTGTSTVWTKAMTGRKFKADAFETIFRIAKYTSTTSIELESTYNDDDVDDGDYEVFQDEYLCPENWRDILSIRDYRTGKELDKLSRRRFLGLHPVNNPSTSSPTEYCFFETRDVTKINIDPVSTILVSGELVTGGTSTAYGKIVKSTKSFIYVEIFYGTFSDGETLTDETGNTATVDEPDGYTEGNVGGMLRLVIYPAPYQAEKLDCDVVFKVYDMKAAEDEPLIPEEYRDILIFGACADLARNRGKLEESATFEALFMERTNRMAAELMASHKISPRIIPYGDRVSYA